MGTTIKHKIIHEMRLFLLYSLFLILFFCSLTTYQRLLLGEYSIGYIHYSYSVIQALVLAKIIVLGENFRIGEKWEDKPLIFPTLYKTVCFSFLTLIFTVLEAFVMGFFRGTDPEKVYQELMDNRMDAVLAKVCIVFFVFILFFAFTETSRVLGEGKLFNLFFRKR